VRSELRVELLIGAVVVLATTLVPAFSGDVYWLQVFLLVDLYIVAAVGLNIMRGEAGQLSFGQGAIFGAGAYGTALATAEWGLALLPALLVGIGIAFAAGLLLALPALRVQGYYLAFVTLAAAVVFPDLLRAGDSFTHAVTGLAVPVSGINDRIAGELTWLAIVILALTLGALALHALLRSSRFGRRMRVTAEAPEAAPTLGISARAMRVAAFAIAALLTGIAGALYAPLYGFVSSGAFPLALSILLYFAVIVGGQSTIVGPLFGIYLLYIVPNVLLTGLTQYRLIIYGVVAYVVLVLFPDGVVGSIATWLRGRREAKRAAPAVHLDRLPAAAPAAAAGEPRAVLGVRDAVKRFGEVRALDGASLEAFTGQVHALVGANGSGKTTLLNALSGLIRLDAGEVTIAGEDVTRRSARSRARLGLGRSFQTPRVFADMTVWENLDVTPEGAAALAADPSLRSDFDRLQASALPHAQRRLLEIARVIAMRPRVLLLDEPAAGLSPEEREEFGRTIRRLAHESVTAVVLVEHDLSLVWRVADLITVMDQGATVFTGDPEQVRSSRAVDLLFSEGVHAEGR
jgi:branched-chain amino acid transport system permease protein